MKCHHCNDLQYVLGYTLQDLFNKNKVALSDIPAPFFKKIPLEYIYKCHCNIRLVLFSRQDFSACRVCFGTTWRFSQVGYEIYGFEKTILELSPEVLVTQSCSMFERCDCHENHSLDDGETSRFVRIIEEFKKYRLSFNF